MAQPDTPRSSVQDSAPGAGRSGGGGSAHRLVAALLLVVALGGIALATLGASADRGSLGSYDGPTREVVTVPGSTPPPSIAPEQEQPSEAPEPPQPRSSSGTGSLLLVILLAVVVTALAVWLLIRMRALARPPLEEAEELSDVEELTVEQARGALADARERLSTEVDAQDAVIAAWLALESTIAAVGIRRRPSQTTLEYVVDVLAGVDLDAGDLDRLAHLYRRALFDAAPLTETGRESALSLLDRLTAQLDQHAGAPGSKAVPPADPAPPVHTGEGPR